MDIATLWACFTDAFNPNSENYLNYYDLFFDIITYLSEINDRLVVLETI